MPHHHPCYCTDITKNSSPISKTLLLLAMSISLADTSQKKRYIHVDRWALFRDSLLYVDRWALFRDSLLYITLTLHTYPDFS